MRLVRESLAKYVDLARRLGYTGGFKYELGTDIVQTASRLIESLVKK